MVEHDPFTDRPRKEPALIVFLLTDIVAIPFSILADILEPIFGFFEPSHPPIYTRTDLSTEELSAIVQNISFPTEARSRTGRLLVARLSIEDRMALLNLYLSSTTLPEVKTAARNALGDKFDDLLPENLPTLVLNIIVKDLSFPYEFRARSGMALVATLVKGNDRWSRWSLLDLCLSASVPIEVKIAAKGALGYVDSDLSLLKIVRTQSFPAEARSRAGMILVDELAKRDKPQLLFDLYLSNVTLPEVKTAARNALGDKFDDLILIEIHKYLNAQSYYGLLDFRLHIPHPLSLFASYLLDVHTRIHFTYNYTKVDAESRWEPPSFDLAQLHRNYQGFLRKLKTGQIEKPILKPPMRWRVN